MSGMANGKLVQHSDTTGLWNPPLGGVGIRLLSLWLERGLYLFITDDCLVASLSVVTERLRKRVRRHKVMRLPQ